MKAGTATIAEYSVSMLICVRRQSACQNTGVTTMSPRTRLLLKHKQVVVLFRALDDF
jgi:hypothetical protein